MLLTKTKFKTQNKVDINLRRLYCDLAERLLAGKISTSEYEDLLFGRRVTGGGIEFNLRKTQDDALKVLFHMLDSMLDSLRNYYLTGSDSLDADDEALAERFIVFLRSGQTWPWPVIHLTIAERIVDFFTRGNLEDRITRKRWRMDELQEYWPFRSEQDLISATPSVESS